MESISTSRAILCCDQPIKEIATTDRLYVYPGEAAGDGSLESTSFEKMRCKALSTVNFHVSQGQ